MTARKRKVVATEETQTVTFSRRRRAVAIEEETTPEYPPVAWAPGWNHMPQLTDPVVRAQRDDQVHAALEYLAVVASGDPRDDARAVACASLILRAGPGASPLERTLGRL